MSSTFSDIGASTTDDHSAFNEGTAGLDIDKEWAAAFGDSDVEGESVAAGVSMRPRSEGHDVAEGLGSLRTAAFTHPGTSQTTGTSANVARSGSPMEMDLDSNDRRVDGEELMVDLYFFNKGEGVETEPTSEHRRWDCTSTRVDKRTVLSENDTTNAFPAGGPVQANKAAYTHDRSEVDGFFADPPSRLQSMIQPTTPGKSLMDTIDPSGGHASANSMGYVAVTSIATLLSATGVADSQNTSQARTIAIQEGWSRPRPRQAVKPTKTAVLLKYYGDREKTAEEMPRIWMAVSGETTDAEMWKEMRRLEYDGSIRRNDKTVLRRSRKRMESIRLKNSPMAGAQGVSAMSGPATSNVAISSLEEVAIWIAAPRDPSISGSTSRPSSPQAAPSMSQPPSLLDQAEGDQRLLAIYEGERHISFTARGDPMMSQAWLLLAQSLGNAFWQPDTDTVIMQIQTAWDTFVDGVASELGPGSSEMVSNRAGEGRCYMTNLHDKQQRWRKRNPESQLRAATSSPWGYSRRILMKWLLERRLAVLKNRVNPGTITVPAGFPTAVVYLGWKGTTDANVVKVHGKVDDEVTVGSDDDCDGDPDDDYSRSTA